MHKDNPDVLDGSPSALRVEATAMEKDFQGELAAILSKLDCMHQDIQRFTERSNQRQYSLLLDDCRSSFLDVVLRYATEEIETGLEGRMVRGCGMRDVCKALFSDLLRDNLGQVREGRASEEKTRGARSRMQSLRERAPRKECESCFSEAARLLYRQIDPMHSLKIYRDPGAQREEIVDLPEDAVVAILEPLSNRQRLQIMKSLASEARTFSALSALTGLRGGNLLFHLQKLMERGMMLQRHERGDYMITAKGYKVLTGIAELYSELEGGRAHSRPVEGEAARAHHSRR